MDNKKKTRKEPAFMSQIEYRLIGGGVMMLIIVILVLLQRWFGG